MQMIVARMTCGRKKYEARLPMPVGASRDVAAIRALKAQLRLLLAEQVVKGAEVHYTRETLTQGVLR